jgi:hypothetical protein
LILTDGCVTHVYRFVDRDMFLRHFGHGVGHGQPEEVETNMDADLTRNDDDVEGSDEHDDNGSEEEDSLASESDNDDGSDDGCGSDDSDLDLGYASF